VREKIMAAPLVVLSKQRPYHRNRARQPAAMAAPAGFSFVANLTLAPALSDTRHGLRVPFARPGHVTTRVFAIGTLLAFLFNPQTRHPGEMRCKSA